MMTVRALMRLTKVNIVSGRMPDNMDDLEKIVLQAGT